MAAVSEKRMHVTVITPARKVLDEEVAAATVPAFDGEIGILPGHAALVTLLGSGEVRVTKPDGSKHRFAVRGGFAQVKDNTVSILTPESVSPEELKVDVVRAELEKVSAAPPADEKGPAREERKAKVAWAKARMKLVENKTAEKH